RGRNYTDSFGGTSSSAPGVAGVAALLLAVNKALRQEEVRDILKRSCDAIDIASGRYEAATGHSEFYGYGRVNAAKAVDLARPRRSVKATPAAKKKPARRKTRKAKHA